jgi:light-regulated signal transduction histidine kinase (bacteriophytochrome)/CheY-like chemotaxis protein
MDIQLPNLTAATLMSLEDCSPESIYAPGVIQPHGILFTLEVPEFKILQVSDTVEQHLGIAVTDLLGQPLHTVFSKTQVKQLATQLTAAQQPYGQAVALKTKRTAARTGHRFRGTLYHTQAATILELEPQVTPLSASSHPFVPRLQSAILKLRSAQNLDELAQVITQEVKGLTGCDRVMVYRFAPDRSGVVIAEAKEPHLESYLGLHYPATDIPAAARKLFYRNWVRHIPDVNQAPAHLIPTLHPVHQTPVDLSTCALRGVHPAHVEYLQNMGVCASITIALIDEQDLWGLIACHHYQPHWVDYETQKTCEFLGQFASMELINHQERDLQTYRTQIRDLQDKLQKAFFREPDFIESVLIRNTPQLLDLVHAQGAALLLGDRLTLIGQTPTQSEVLDLVKWIVNQQPERVFASAAASQIYPPAAQFQAIASGILAISIQLSHVVQKSYHLLWFRPEQVQIVHWAGDLQGAIALDDRGNMQLCPRKSFELWKQTVCGRSLPWQTAEVEAAVEMRNTLMLAALEFSQVALEQAAERAAIANRAKSQFLAKMSHELRTPLNVILGFAQVMNRSPNIPAEFQEHLGIISRSGDHLLNLINDVLEMSRIEAGQLVLTERCCNLHRLLMSMQEMFALKASQKGLTLTFKMEPSVPRYICSDAAKLRQILINLLSNALKFTPSGGIELRVATELVTAQPQCCDCYPTQPAPCQPLKLTIEVEDTGCGIAVSDWETVFEAFMQTDQGRDAQGTGLGLAISRQFARLMGGDISLQSVVNQGTTFTCTVILRQPPLLELPELQPNVLQVLALAPGQPTYRILVVEDLPENRQLLVTLLESVGFEVDAVADGMAAIAHWQTWQPHLIFMDIQMPGLDGYETTRQIRSLSGTRPATPTKIVALTANAFDSDRYAALLAGCDDYITKPFTEIILFETITRHLAVRYHYSQLPANQSQLKPRSLTPQDLQVMPQTWLQQVHEAALDLNENRLLDLISQISDTHLRLTEDLSNLVTSFELETIANLTKPIINDTNELTDK